MIHFSGIASNDIAAGPFQRRSKSQLRILHRQRDNTLPHATTRTIHTNSKTHEHEP